eukprot:TRINITY_DN121686_c0_g1_i1.p1 TRINITY_DN121686_c0_g1~~TRINITY_DN121686_c0_g1_i1.p1  ORF type:complete len:385 (+),score=82.10 TRINITY_DN121686_c0_g1_i1:69-1223(+)
MQSLAEYVATIGQLAGAEDKAVTLVCGNEAADADSIVTALLHSYLVAETEGSTAVPLMKCRREDIHLRSETCLLLKKCGVDPAGLLFSDDVATPGLIKRCQSIVLTDHNALDGPLLALGDEAELTEKVAEIIDHHQDLGKLTKVTGDKRNIAFADGKATAASACSLVAEKFLASDAGQSLLAANDAAVARALLGVILIDSANLDPAAKKVCDRDVAAASQLMKITAMSSSDELFKALSDAKFDAEFWASLPVEKCIAYDFKNFTKAGKSCGISSVLCDLKTFTSKAGWLEAASAKVNEYDVFGVMTATKTASGMQRELALIAKDANLAKLGSDFLAKYESGLLQLEPYEGLPGPEGMMAFRQNNGVASRKQVAPGLLAFFESIG